MSESCGLFYKNRLDFDDLLYMVGWLMPTCFRWWCDTGGQVMNWEWGGSRDRGSPALGIMPYSMEVQDCVTIIDQFVH